MKTANHLPLRHISLRVPWHDNGWDGTVCKAPRLNSACLKLNRIAGTRKDDAEQAVAGISLKVLDEQKWPCCVAERGMFMAPFEYTHHANHPYKATSPETHGHFGETPMRHPPYSAAGLPFRWMFRETMEQYGESYQINVDMAREPDLGFSTNWVQEKENHLALLNCFFGHIKPEGSLCFFYAKQVPFVEDMRRVIVGVGRVLHVGEPIEYKYEREGKLKSLLWERMIQHSIRPEFQDGFLLPYHAAIEHAAENPDFDPADVIAFAPADHFDEFSYASEHVTNDGAIAALLACAASLNRASKSLSGPWAQCLKWIDARLAELWKMRGPCPGLGAALCAFGIDHGTFVARELETKLAQNEDPWPLVDKMFANPKAHLSAETAKQIHKTLQETWKHLANERRALLQLVSRFEILPEQAAAVFVQEERQKAGVECTDREILENPYRIYEAFRWTADPIGLQAVDRGVFPEAVVREKHPLPEPSCLDGGSDARRVRALAVNILESASGDGHTLLPRKDCILKLRALEIQPSCEVTSDLMTVTEATFLPEIQMAEMKDGVPAHQLCRLAKMGEVIRGTVNRRKKGKRLLVAADWRNLLDEHLGKIDPKDAEREEHARREKAASLKELAESRFSVLIGPAGTGKTTLLSILCSQKNIAAGGVLLLAPTGKARVRMEQVAKEKKLQLKGLTIAQFLGKCGRYDYQTGRYHLSAEKPDEIGETVIVDEASMLTEEMLGALLESLKSADRVILVGDPRQLPPIGSGRPFVDIISELAPDDIHARFPRIAEGYAELTVRRRQAGQIREDLQLAEWFSGAPMAPGEDDVFNTVVKTGGSNHIGFVAWESPDEFQKRLLDVMVKELGLSGLDDQAGFNQKLGATVSGEYCYFNRGAAKAAEQWQILSPVRPMPHGVTAINRLIHKQFRSQMIEFAQRTKYRKIPRPMGAEEIVYGDKVINVENHFRKHVWPEEGCAKYLANGEIGIATGQFKTANMTKPPWELQVEFSSQMGFAYKFRDWDFGEEAQPRLELAYALSVHKSQGSEFNLVLLALPNPCRLLSRELLYTALTRQRDRVVILHQGNRMDLKRFASDRYSVTATRLTNLFKAPAPVEVGGQFFEDRLIHRTRRGELVRSKSEVIVADRLADMDIDYVYEKELSIDGVSKFPDFTIKDAESGTTFFWEHCGMLHDPEYRARWEQKLQWYRLKGILPHEEGGGQMGTLIVTRDNEQGGISSQDIEAVIRTVILGQGE